MFLGIGLGIGMTGLVTADSLPLPTITVTGGVITPFSREGVSYVEIRYETSGSFHVSRDTPLVNGDLAGGAAAAGKSTGGFIPAGGGAGRYVPLTGIILKAGLHTINIGAGAPSYNSVGLGADGSASTYIAPDATYNAPGGGRGASSGTGNTDGAPGGSGGGGRGFSSGGNPGAAVAGSPLAGHGFPGGNGFPSATSSERSGGGGGGAGGPGGNGTSGVPGARGPGITVTWGSIPRTVCVGGLGAIESAEQQPSPDKIWACGSDATQFGPVGKAGNGFATFVVRADEVQVVAA